MIIVTQLLCPPTCTTSFISQLNTFLMSYEHIKVGITVHLHPFVEEVFKYFGISPFQISPNEARAILGLYVLYVELNFPPLTPREFGWYYLLAKTPSDPGFYCFRTRKDVVGIRNIGR